MFEWWLHLRRVMRWIDQLRTPKANPWRAVFCRYAINDSVSGLFSDRPGGAVAGVLRE